MNKPGIIIGILREISNFAIIKYFIRIGIEVTVFDNDPEAPGFFIPGVQKKLITPDPETSPVAFIEFMLEFGAKNPGNVLLINDDPASQLIAENRGDLKKYFRILVPDGLLNEMAFDKAKTSLALEKYMVPAPKTYVLTNFVDNFKKTEIEFPLVLKPRSSGGSRGQFFVNNRRELNSALDKIGDKKPSYIAQEWIPGDVTSLCNLAVLFDHKSEPKAVFTCRKLSTMRSKHIYQGIATYYISEKIPEIINIGLDFFKKIKWQGLAELEFKYDKRDAKFKMFEINPRVWAWIRLPMECGVNFPKIYYDLQSGENVELQCEFRSGVTLLRTVIDSYSLYNKYKDGEIKFSALCGNVIKKYSRLVLHPKENIVEELPWNSPNMRWISFYMKRLKKYG
ncbi:ATP-grasp domain-containing protein [candidate division WS5 bacterium]|uniref:ATP-grasp domain-containing protein n=1 Tax=candidate division WS5 bacterium TaxID=2093353 RepID=A0A419DDB3_9BACT|nr:MAG: ATP-grasp domain-containing protein [candidate division WS5 bacterium]